MDHFRLRRSLRLSSPSHLVISAIFLGFCFGPLCCRVAMAQMDQGTITGMVTDSSGAAVPGATVKLTSTDTGLALQTTSDGSGVFTFSPVKIGNYEVRVSAPGFRSTVQQHLQLNLQERLNVPIVLNPGGVTQTVTVSSAPPLLETQQSSTGQVVTTTAIDQTPLNGRNWVYIAQLTAGVDQGTGGRGTGTGDFSANGQRPEQNNFILDGVDNNTNTVDFLNGASYVVRPPPDALAEFKIDTGDYSAEFGHSAGAVMNASLKSGTNKVSGDLWEYFRNSALDAKDFNAQSVPKYRENQFGATLGFPIVRNHLFFFGDAEANRIIYGTPTIESVPTPLMRQGNFSELLNTVLTGKAKPTLLYEPNSGGTALLQCGGEQNVFCRNQVDTVAQNILTLYPLPNANAGRTYNNYIVNLNDSDNTWQWDTRVDWNARPQDQMFARFSYDHEGKVLPSPLGPVLDGGFFDQSGNVANMGENFAYSETHLFSPVLVNEFRFGYNYGHFTSIQSTAANDLAPSLNFGGVPFTPGQFNGGLPLTNLAPLSRFGTPNATPSIEHENVYQILDNVTRIVGNHSLKFGITLQSIRFATIQPSFGHGAYTFNGLYTSNRNASFTGYGAADFLADQMFTASVSTMAPINDVRWYRAAYFQDDWRVTPKLTLNVGLRYDYTQPIRENAARQANFLPGASLGAGTGSGVYQLPQHDSGMILSPSFTQLMAANHITVQYVSNPFLISAQKTNFAPRIGLAYSLDSRTVLHAGFGLFYGGIENLGAAPNLGRNYPFQFTDSFPAPSCKAGYGNCNSNGLTVENGFSAAINAGLQNYVFNPVLNGEDPLLQTPYSMEDNFTIERSLTNDMVASVGYVGTMARHLQTVVDSNPAFALMNPANKIQNVEPFPTLGAGVITDSIGVSSYNSLQTKLEKRYANGMDFLATYTWAHSLDDAVDPLMQGGVRYPDPALVPVSYDYSNSVFDVRHRFTFNGYYELPFGRGKAHLNHGGILNALVGGWADTLTFAAQTGLPFTVTPNISTAGGISARAIVIRSPFAAGGAPDPSNPGIQCAARTRTRTNWYNPCSFANPLPGSTIPTSGSGSQVTALSEVLQYVGGKRNTVTGPGYERINMSAFKSFPTFREEQLVFRADIFNLLNTPAYGIPSITTDNSNGGQITAPQAFQNLTPDARFFQLSLKYLF